MKSVGRCSSIKKLAFPFTLALIASAVSQVVVADTTNDQIMRRLNTLEKENIALRAKVKNLDSRFTATPVAQKTNILATAPSTPLSTTTSNLRPRPRFEISGSLLYLQPGAGNLEYGTLIDPYPLASPHWTNQSISPKFTAAFDLGFGYRLDEANDLQLNWTHLKTTDGNSFRGNPATQMVGPPYIIGPESTTYSIGAGTVKFNFDSVKLELGHNLRMDGPFQVRVFGGLEFAKIKEALTGLFQTQTGSDSHSYINNSTFTGIGPRLGLKAQYFISNIQFFTEIAGAALIGTSQSSMDFTTRSQTNGVSAQSLSSPNSTQVIPSIESKIGSGYTFPETDRGIFKIELGYEASIYFNAINSYTMTQVPTGIIVPPTGIYLATLNHVQSNFTVQGPYLKGSWAF
jgi:hypothetical protein